MQNRLHIQLGSTIVLILVIPICSQGQWLGQQLKNKRDNFTSKIEDSLESIIYF